MNAQSAASRRKQRVCDSMAPPAPLGPGALNVAASGVAFSITVDYRVFTRLARDPAAQHGFLQCRPAPPPERRRVRVHRKEIDHAAQSWSRMNRRLRSLVSQAVLDVTLASLTRALEASILFFAESGTTPPACPPELENALGSPLVVSQGGRLELNLTSSPFHRLLVHAVASFHGLSSASEHRGKGRVTCVSRGEIVHRVSLVAFVLNLRLRSRPRYRATPPPRHPGNLPSALAALSAADAAAATAAEAAAGAQEEKGEDGPQEQEHPQPLRATAVAALTAEGVAAAVRDLEDGAGITSPRSAPATDISSWVGEDDLWEAGSTEWLVVEDVVVEDM